MLSKEEYLFVMKDEPLHKQIVITISAVLAFISMCILYLGLLGVFIGFLGLLLHVPALAIGTGCILGISGVVMYFARKELNKGE